MFGREELGRSRLLRDCAREVREGKLLQPRDIANRCEDHVRKQAAADFHLTLKPSLDSQWGKAIRALSEHDPSSEQWHKANQLIDIAVDAKRKRQPEKRHQARCSNLYVDLNHQGTDWLRPVDVAKDEAHDEINSAISDYMHEVRRLTNEESYPILEQYQPHLSVKAMSIARSKMSHPVDIPQPRWLP